MSLTVVVLGMSFLAGASWSLVVLTDEDRYLWAVSPLAASPMFARLAGASVSIAVRHRGRWRRALPPRAARAVGTGTRWGMGTRAFSPSWVTCHRMLHRHRHRQSQSQWRVAALMILLATMGSIIGATSRMVGPAAVGTRRSGQDPMTTS